MHQSLEFKSSFRFIITLLISSLSISVSGQLGGKPDTTTLYQGESHLKNIRQLTRQGDYAEAYFSFDNSMISFQAKNPAWNAPCDQIYYFAFKDGDMLDHIPKLISNGVGRTTCSYFLPGDTTILYASTRSGGDACPPEPAHRTDGKYLWPVYADFDIYVADLKGHIIDTLVKSPGYDAEATVSPKGDRIVFTSDRSGDLELYTCDIHGKDVKQVTYGLGYDGGAFFSPDGKKLVFRASRPQTPEEVQEYKDLLKQHLVAPVAMEIYTCNVDGTDLKQVTHLGKANWAPYFSPSGKKIIFSSNHAGSRGFNFNLFMVNLDGTGLEQITRDPVFDAFPMFSHDGKKLIFSSNRNNGGTHFTNLFIADWVE
ncbi:MAG: PD40 domain-containing protein [Bacteroidetes bacterium]|nr:PD40 domain-containing protein [Bacteroidota bacterium]